MVSKLEELWNKCLESTENFDELKKHIPYEELEVTDLEQFIKLCDNRIDLSKTFLYATVILFGFGLTSLLLSYPILSALSFPIPTSGRIFGGIILLLMLSYLVYLFVKLRQYIKHEIGWSTIKEMALMNYAEKVKESKSISEERHI